MQQESFFYPSGAEVPQSDTGLPYANPYQMEPNVGSWPSNFVAPNMGVANNLYNSAASLQCDQSAHLLTPVSTAMYGTTPTCSWAHTVPNLMPWVPRPEVTVPDPVKRFSAPFPPDPCTSQTATSWELLHNLGTNNPNPNLHLKRKGDVDFIDATPPKLCVTEEKMAARFREMHISNQYTVPANNSISSSSVPNPTVEKPVTNLQQLEIMLQDSNSSDICSKSIILAPELKKLVEPEKILSTFLNKIERPSMALLVWEPPKNKLPTEENDKKQEDKSGAEFMENNNNVMSEQLNTLCQQYSASQSNSSDQSQMMMEDSMDT